jgi:D-alanine-D-alanine ligase
MERRVRVGLLFGGRSSEHEVSLQSAASIASAIDASRFEVVPIGITREGRWLLPADSAAALRRGPGAVGGEPLALVPAGDAALVPVGRAEAAAPVDVVFPVLHGPNGEDGTVQGLLELAGVPYVGSGVLGSAVGMDKAAMKHLLRQHGLPVVDFWLVRRPDWERDPEGVVGEAERRFGYPCFVKPCNMGSSVGVTKAHDRAELRAGLERAASFDRRLLVERAVDAREIECGVLGNDDPVASVPGEVVPAREFYDYEAKYHDERLELRIPAPLEPSQAAEIQALSVAAFRALDCAGLARVDFFLERGTGRIYVNEVNTMPGFTRVSMYPKLWEASGLPYTDLITRLIELAFERHRDRDRTRTDR